MVCTNIFVLVGTFVEYGTGHSLTFFTTWNYLMHTAHFVLACVITGWIIRDSVANRTFYRIAWMVSQVALTGTLLVGVVFWCVLYPSANEEDQ